jgi:DNA polymerase-3 subunit epsilon/ATP-dependent DNA helicase DinG
LPFSIPRDPVVQARGESFDDSFNDYMLPESILKLRQAVGRMERGDSTQRGVIAILDRRMTSKGYGRKFIESLPPYSIVRIPLSEIATEASRWFGK